ncbi:peptidase S8 [Rhodanobacter sp. Root561]|uniref:S8 family serine peptidase n=1 Tax=Rhodanobacter sp. Root561 TaxID=1736560 RepID=UPI0006FB58E8|nr:S8 family serine peptidase [Rhodanobacter sp. Root561]KQZ77591.1 peptidase S8 [Rhodanobacter sp. Root561]
MPLRRPSALLFSLLTIASFRVGATSVQAQLLGPVQHLPDLQAPGAGLPPVLSTPPLRSMDDLLRGSLSLTRKLQIDVLRRSESRRVDVDPQGAPILRGEFLATGLWGAPLDAVRALGFSVDRATPADATLGLDFVVLHDTRARSTARAMRALRQAAPDAAFTYQHLYLPAGTDDVAAAATSATPSSNAPPQRVGLIDGGVDPSDPALVRARIERHGCSAANPSRHGTAVAARLVAGDPDTLYAADLWCGDAVGGATSNLVDALAWMAREHVAVINISLVGPDNPVLAQAVRAMIARGHVLVSAVGNDGPAAPPLFPAAYPDVIGVSGVDARDRVLPESGSGDQVDFCASGVLGSGRNALRGTSFAAPIVARKAAQWLDAPRAGAAADVQRHLAGEARDLGPAGRDPRYGNGLLSP